MLACLLLCAIALHAQEPYAALSDDNTVLTFYYDTHKADRNGMSVGPFEYVYYPTNSPTTSWYNRQSAITTVVFDASFADCTSLASTACWFYGCSKLSNITGIENLKTDKVTSMSYVFSGCSGLTSLDVSGFNTDNVTNMNCMFYDCSGLTSLDVSGFKNDNVTDMTFMFYYCYSLTNLDVSGFNTEKVTSMGWMFRGCSSLTSLDVSGFNTDKVTSMGSMFYGCSGLKTIYAGDGWSTEKVIHGDDMFSDCTSLVGGEGTAFDSSHTDYTYARIDGGEENPGYFTYKAPTDDKTTKLESAGHIAEATPAAYFSVSGRQVTSAAKGLNIVRMSDGTVRKVLMK